jgi:hypothetical protein
MAYNCKELSTPCCCWTRVRRYITFQRFNVTLIYTQAFAPGQPWDVSMSRW